MEISTQYLFKSERLGFRNWLSSDIELMSKINSNAEVMEFFPSILNVQQTSKFIERMQNMFEQKGFCYFAVDTLIEGELIGFIGLAEQTYNASFTPCVDIGWRLHSKYWNKGYATEGAKACLKYAFDVLNLEKIVAVAPIINLKSIAVMKKIGMKYLMSFTHPFLMNDDRLKECVVYDFQNKN